MKQRLRWIGVVLVLGAMVSACLPVGPGGEPQPVDCAHWRYGAKDEPAPGALPTELDRDSYKTASRARSQTRAGLRRHTTSAVRRARPSTSRWVPRKGRDDVLIAVLDSGIKWRDAGAMADLATKAYINLGEARPPCASADR